jgi:putative methyltransferase (TIGR04325 family)
MGSSAVRTFVKALLPPVVAKPLARLWPSRERAVLEFYPDGWNRPLLSDGESGWNTETVVEAEHAKWEAFKKNLSGAGPLGFSHESTDLTVTRDVYFHNIHISYAYVLTLAAAGLTKIRVLDWGGGLGHYYLLGRAVLPDVEFQFDCRDVPLMCERGRKLCPDVTFYDNDSCLENKYDLVLVNGSLGYFENWQDVLRRLAACVTGYLFVTRVLAVRDSPSFVVLQRTEIYDYHSDMLTQVFNETEILDLIRGCGLKLVREFVVGDGPTILGAPEQSRDCGWLFQRGK